MRRTKLMGLPLACALVVSVTQLAVAKTNDTVPTKCPLGDSKNITVNLAHETNCSKYYSCRGGEKEERLCPPMDKNGNRLHFNPVLQVCDWPSNARCKIPKGRSLVVPITAIPTQCPEVDSVDTTVHLAHENNCSMFYKCLDGKKYPMVCPLMDNKGHRLHFNVSSQTCDWPWNVDCKLPNSRSIIVPVSAVVPRKCPLYNTAGNVVHLAHETDCTKFYKCNHGQKVEMNCPFVPGAGYRLQFNEAAQQCDWPENVQCNQPPVNENNPCGGTCPSQGSCYDASHATTIPHGNECDKYCICRNGQGNVMNCPSGLHYSTANGVCVSPSDSECGSVTSPSPSTPASSTPTPSTPASSTPTPSTPASSTPTPSTPASSTPTPSTPASSTPTPSTPASSTPTPSTPASSTPTPSIPASSTPTPSIPASSTPTPSTPASSTPTPSTPASSTPTPSTPASSTPTPSTPASSTPTPSTSASSTPTPSTPASSTPTPSTPESSTPTPSTPASSTPTPSTPASSTPTPSTPASSTFTPTPASSTPTPSTPTPSTPTSQGCIGTCPFKDPPYVLHLPNQDCSKFCKCDNGHAHTMHCPGKLHFNPRKQVCDYPQVAKCVNGPYKPELYQIL